MFRPSVLRRALAATGLFVALAAMPGVALAKDEPAREAKRDKLAFFDSRQTPAAKLVLRGKAKQLAESPKAATEELRDSLGSEGIVSIDPLTSTPRLVGKLDGFLTGSSGKSAQDVALDYARANAAALNLAAGDLANLTLARDYVSIDGTHHLFFQQRVNGVPVFGNGLKANVTKDGRLINMLGSPVSAATGSTSPGISSAQAVASARTDAAESIVPYRSVKGGTVQRKTTFSNGDRASLVFFRAVEGLRLAWQTYVSAPEAQFLYVIDAANGRVLYRRSLVQNANGLVFENYPGATNGGTQVERSISDNGWLPAGATTLSGPNTHVYTDVDDSNDASNSNDPVEPEEISPSGGGNWLYPVVPFHFANPLEGIYGCNVRLCTWNPSFTDLNVPPPVTPGPAGDYSYQVNRNQSGTQLFWLVNNFHDHLEAAPIGFTNAAGNFEGNDPVLGEALDGANSYGFGFPDPNHTDNANMATPPDGFSPRMQMYLWHDTTTDAVLGPEADPFLPADGSNEANIVYHEYTHGLSNRLVVDASGNSTLGNIQAGAMGEAWSDWYAFDYLVKTGLVSDTAADGEIRLGAYVAKNQDLIRTQPLDCSVGSTSAACHGTAGAGPGGYTYGDFGKIIGRPEVHADGEIWASTLWDLRGVLGVPTTEGLVTRAMELSPNNPSFLDMRNSILQADIVATGGANRDKIWSVFAKRGMGYFAAATDGDDAQPVEDFTLPPGPKAKTAKLKGTVVDSATKKPIDGAVVAFGGHASGFPGDFSGVADKNGKYDIKKIFVGTYPKVFAQAPGYDRSVRTVTIGQGNNTEDWSLRRDWAALSGGGTVAAFDGPDFTPFGCGPTAAIDQSLGLGWGSITGTVFPNTTPPVITPKSITIKLPVKVNATEIAIDPSNTCGDAGSASTKDYRLETSPDGATWTLAKQDMFGVANRGKLNVIAGIPAGALSGIQYVRFTMLNPQVPNLDGSMPPFGDEAVTEQCPGNFSGCDFMDMTELAVYGAPA
jgi:hypothetical protein